MKLFDTHCHYEDAAFDADRYERIKSLRNTDVERFLNCCSDESVFDTVMSIAESSSSAYCSIGIHPHWCATVSENWIQRIAELANNPQVIALGEMGLDYYFDDDRDLQKAVFRNQLELAEQLGMPVIIHDRLAHQDVMDILREYKPKGILHRYGGSIDLAMEAINWGMFVSINNDITYPGWEERHGDLLYGLPLENLLAETDAPYSLPFGSNKKRSEADDVRTVIETIASYRKIDAERLADIIFENSLRAYGL